MLKLSDSSASSRATSLSTVKPKIAPATFQSLVLGLIFILTCFCPAICMAAGTVTPASLSWASVAIGNTGGPKSVTLTNSGTAAISMSSVALTGADSGDFAISAKTCGTSLAASASCMVTILFKPTVAGTRTATFTFTDTEATAPRQSRFQEKVLVGLREVLR